MNPEVSVSEQTQPRTNIVRVVAASMAGTTVEWYDFFLYGVAAALVFPHVFFPTGNATAATLASLGTFAVGFLARPVGGLVFGHYGDRIGRKKLLVLSLLMMGLSTFAIGLLPCYATSGVLAPMLLVVLRLIQGFALGGEWGGAVLIVSEHGDPARRGFWASWPQAGAPAGQLIANGLLAVMAVVQSEADFLAWGWRIPFLLSAVLVLIGLWIRLVGGGVAGVQGRPAPTPTAGGDEQDADPRRVPPLPARGAHRDGRPVRRERLVLHLHDRDHDLRDERSSSCPARSCWAPC